MDQLCLIRTVRMKLRKIICRKHGGSTLTTVGIVVFVGKLILIRRLSVMFADLVHVLGFGNKLTLILI